MEESLHSAKKWPFEERVAQVFWRGSDNGKFVDDEGQVSYTQHPTPYTLKLEP
jgi:hypothetical protein